MQSWGKGVELIKIWTVYAIAPFVDEVCPAFSMMNTEIYSLIAVLYSIQVSTGTTN